MSRRDFEYAPASTIASSHRPVGHFGRLRDRWTPRPLHIAVILITRLKLSDTSVMRRHGMMNIIKKVAMPFGEIPVRPVFHPQ